LTKRYQCGFSVQVEEYMEKSKIASCPCLTYN